MKWLGVGVIAAALGWMMWMPVPDVDDHPLTSNGGPARPIEFAYSADPMTRGTHVAVIGVVMTGPQAWDHLFLRIATFSTTPRLQSATLETNGCVVARAEGGPDNNQLAEFRRELGCDPPAAGVRGEIRVTFNGPGRLAVWGTPPPAGSTPPLAIISGLEGQFDGLVPDARVRIDSGRPGVSRITLLAFVWQLRVSSLIVLLIVIAGITAGGLVLMPGTRRDGEVRGAFMGRAAAACGLLVAGVTMLYAVSIPPLQAPDESAHLLTYAELTGGAPLQLDVRRLAERTHFDRIRFHPDERFLPMHRSRPHHAEWDHQEAAVGQMERRSPLGLLLWRAASSVLPSFPTAHALLGLRMINAVTFGLAAAACVAFVGCLTLVRQPQLIVLPLLIAPAIPFFAMAVSNYALMTGAAALLGGGIVIMMANGPRAPWSGWIIAMGGTVLLATSHSAISILPLLIAVGLSRCILSGSGSKARWRDAVIFWLPVVLMPGAWMALTTVRYQNEAFGLITMRVPPAASAALTFIHAHWPIFAVPGLLGALLEWGLQRVWPAATPSRHAGARVFAVAAIALVAGVAMASLVITMPHVPDLNVAPVARSTYVAATLATLVTSARLSDFDLYLGTTFWGRLGWLDTPLPAWMETLGVATVGVLIVWGAVTIGRRGDGRRAAAITTFAVGLLVSAAVYAVASHSMDRNLHGRYLLPLYLPALMVACMPAIHAGGTASRRRVVAGGLVALSLFAIAIALHRYF